MRLQLERLGRTRQELFEIGISRNGYDALEIDVHFMLVAIRQILRYGEKYAKLIDDERLQRGLAAFAAAAPNLAHLRDMLEHLDEYVTGEGRFQEKISMEPRRLLPIFVETSRDPEEDFELLLGDYSIPVKGAAEAAIMLGELLEEVWKDHFSHLRPGTS